MGSGLDGDAIRNFQTAQYIDIQRFVGILVIISRLCSQIKGSLQIIQIVDVIADRNASVVGL